MSHIEVLEKLNKSKIFITGGTGFMGKCLLDFFLEAKKHYPDFQIHICLLSRSSDKFLSQNPHYNELENIRHISADVENFKFPEEKYDYIIHAATPATTQETQDWIQNRPDLMLDTIVNGSKQVIEFCKQQNPKRILFISSGAVYKGSNISIPFLESSFDPKRDSYLMGADAYQQGKILAEESFLNYAAQNISELRIARGFSFIGPHLPYSSYLISSAFIREILEHKTITIKGNGQEIRSFLYTKDLAPWLLNILVQGKELIYNVGSDEKISIFEFAQKIASQINQSLVIVKNSIPTNINPNPNFYVPDINKSKKEFDLSYLRNLDTAIKETLEYHELNLRKT